MSDHLEHMRAADRVATDMAMRLVEVSPGHCVLEMPVADTMLNGLNVCHGGIIFTLADTAMAYATNAGDVPAFATNAEIDFLNKVPPGSLLRAECNVRATRGKQAINDVRVTLVGEPDDGTIVAEFRGRTLQSAPER